MLASGILPLATIYWLRNERRKPGILWFQFVMGSGALWSTVFGLIVLVEAPGIRFALTNVLIVIGPVASIFYFMFCYEFTFKKKTPRAVFGLFVPVVLLFVFSWSNPYNLVYTVDDPRLATEILVPAGKGSVRPAANVGMSTLLVVTSSGMVLGELMSTAQRERKIQASIILVSSFVVTVLVFVKTLGLVPPFFALTPIGWTAAGLLVAISIKRYRFPHLSSTTRDQLIDQIDECLLMLNTDGIVVEANGSATDLFDIEVGMTKRELTERNPALTAVLDSSAVETIERRTADGTQVFDVTRSVLAYGRGAEGTIILLRDITTQRDRKKALEETKERYRRILQHSSDYVSIVDDSETIIDVTSGVQRVLGYDPDDWIGTNAFSHIHPEDKQRVTTAFSRVTADPELELNVEFRALATDGEYRWLEARGNNYLDDPLIRGVLANVRDISERKEREQELDALTTRLELALEETDTGVWEWDLDTDELVWDEACERLFGLDPGEFPGTYEAVADRLSEDDRVAFEQAVTEAIDNESKLRFDFSIERPDGEVRWIQTRGVVEYDAEGDAERMLGIKTDITDRKRAKQELEETKEYYRRLFEQSMDYVTVVDEAGTITDITHGVTHVLGYDPDEMVGTDAFSYIHPDDRDRLGEVLADAVENPETDIVIEYRARTSDGGYRWMEARGSNELEDQLLDGIVVYIRDITQRKERQQELSTKTDRLQQKNEQLERLARIVSHDLQTPLSTAEKLTGLLRSDLDDPDPAVEQSLSDLEATHRRLRGFADHLPRLARESTDIQESTACDLRSVAEAAWDVVDTGPLELRVDSTRTVEGDPERLQRVFENLFQNTVVHGVTAVDGDQDTEATTVRVGRIDDGFYVSDDGPGIRPEQRAELFEYGMGTGPGSGFGLAIVRTIIEAHGWTITVTDSPTGGARFEVDTT